MRVRLCVRWNLAVDFVFPLYVFSNCQQNVSMKKSNKMTMVMLVTKHVCMISIFNVDGKLLMVFFGNYVILSNSDD